MGSVETHRAICSCCGRVETAEEQFELQQGELIFCSSYCQQQYSQKAKTIGWPKGHCPVCGAKVLGDIFCTPVCEQIFNQENTQS